MVQIVLTMVPIIMAQILNPALVVQDRQVNEVEHRVSVDSDQEDQEAATEEVRSPAGSGTLMALVQTSIVITILYANHVFIN